MQVPVPIPAGEVGKSYHELPCRRTLFGGLEMNPKGPAQRFRRLD